MFQLLKDKLAHLAVNQIAAEVMRDFADGNIPIVNSEVASGKTLLLPALCSTMVDEVIYVLQPRRDLVNNATESLWDIIGPTGPDLIGCLNSSRSDERSFFKKTTRVIFTTVGFALGAEIVHTAKNIIIDEAHETSIDLSLAKSIIHHRRARGEDVRVAILSATLDVENETAFWGDRARLYSTAGSAFPVEHLHFPAMSYGEAVLYLGEEKDCSGILVFVAGKEEIIDAADQIRTYLSMAGYVNGRDFEIATLHGKSTSAERRFAYAAPTCDVKILIATNVLEAGISLPWADGGISSGTTKVMHVEGNSRHLKTEPLPRWRIEQQEGRVRRFKPGVFILADRDSKESRKLVHEPDITRLPITELVMICAKFPNIKISELEFSKRETPPPGKIREAIDDLVAYDLIVEHPDGSLGLTEDGQRIGDLPLSFNAAAAYCEAVRLNRVPQMIPLIAALDVGDLRHDHRYPMGCYVWDKSDIVQQVGAVAYLLREKKIGGGGFADLAQMINLSSKKYRELTALVAILKERTGRDADYEFYLDQYDNNRDVELDRLTKQVIFRSMLRDRYYFNARFSSVETDAGLARMSNTSACASYGQIGGVMAVGNLRTISPKYKIPFTVVERLTIFKRHDLDYLVERFGASVVDPDCRYFNVKSTFFEEPEWVRTPRVNRDRTISRYQANIDPAPVNTLLGDLLSDLLSKK